MLELQVQHPNTDEVEAFSEHPSPKNHSSNSINHHTRHASDALHHLVGVEMQEANGYAEAKDELNISDNGDRYHQLHPKSAYHPQRSDRPEPPFQVRETRSLEQPYMTDDRLIKNALSIGLLSGSAPIVASSLASAGASLATGATAMAGLLAAAPLAGGTIGYFAGKEFKHPVLGAAVGSAVTSAGMLAGLNTAAWGALGGGLTAGGLALTMLPTAMVATGIYGLGEIHNYLWKKEGGDRPGVAGTFLRGLPICSFFSIPAGLVRKVFGSGK